jgi:CheY-like chemotaxis protein
VTATAPEEHADALTVGCAAILTKPYTAAQLEEVLAATVTCAVAPRFGLYMSDAMSCDLPLLAVLR